MSCAGLATRLAEFTALFSTQNWTALQSLYFPESLTVLHDDLVTWPYQASVWKVAWEDGARLITRASTFVQDVGNDRCLEIGRLTTGMNGSLDTDGYSIMYLAEWTKPPALNNTLELFGWDYKKSKRHETGHQPDPRWTDWIERFSDFYNHEQFYFIPTLFPSGQNQTLIVVPERLNTWPQTLSSPDELSRILRTFHGQGLRLSFELLESQTFGGFGHTLLQTNWWIIPRTRLYIRWTQAAKPQLFVLFDALM
jgi:hypothetical protein